MIPHENVCSAVKRMVEYTELHAGEDDYSLTPLMEAVGMDDEMSAHVIEHLVEIGCTIEPSSLVLGMLVALLAADHSTYVPGEELKQSDIDELLGEAS